MKALVLIAMLIATGVQAAVDFEQIVSLIKNNPTTGKPTQNLEELVGNLPLELRSNYTFIYQSRGPHGGLGDPKASAVDRLYPRAVLFSNDGKVTLAFTSHPKKPGYNVVEAIRYRDEGARFELYRYALAEAAPEEHIDPSNGIANPQSCLRCHGQDPRPISDSYPLWPGFYGSVRDTFPKGSKELKWYKKFLASTAKTGPFKNLVWLKDTSVPPYLDPKHYDPNSAEGAIEEMKFLPNTRLGMAWTELNRKRIQRKIKSSPLYKTYRYALLSGFLGCEGMPISEGEINKTYSEIAIENEDRIKRLGTHPQGPNQGSLDMMELAFYGNAVQVDYLARVLKVSRSDWAMAFEKDSFSFFDGILSGIHDGMDFYMKEDFMLEMLRDVAQEEPAFKPYFQSYLAYTTMNYPFGERLDFTSALQACSLLKEKVKVTLPELPVTNTEKKKISKLGNFPFARCVNCHEGEKAIEIGRKIPFRDVTELAKALKQPAVSGELLFDDILQRVSVRGAAQMPPHGNPLTEEEVKNMRRYMEAVL